MKTETTQDYLARGGVIKVCRKRKAKGALPIASAFGGNRFFLASKTVASAEQAGMLRMGSRLKKYGN